MQDLDRSTAKKQGRILQEFYRFQIAVLFENNLRPTGNSPSRRHFTPKPLLFLKSRDTARFFIYVGIITCMLPIVKTSRKTIIKNRKK